jgi:hypothetical protein
LSEWASSLGSRNYALLARGPARALPHRATARRGLAHQRGPVLAQPLARQERQPFEVDDVRHVQRAVVRDLLASGGEDRRQPLLLERLDLLGRPPLRAFEPVAAGREGRAEALDRQPPSVEVHRQGANRVRACQQGARHEAGTGGHLNLPRPSFAA